MVARSLKLKASSLLQAFTSVALYFAALVFTLFQAALVGLRVKYGLGFVANKFIVRQSTSAC